MRDVVVVYCDTCEGRLSIVRDVLRAEKILMDHLDENLTHSATWWTSTETTAHAYQKAKR